MGFAGTGLCIDLCWYMFFFYATQCTYVYIYVHICTHAPSQVQFDTMRPEDNKDIFQVIHCPRQQSQKQNSACRHISAITIMSLMIVIILIVVPACFASNTHHNSNTKSHSESTSNGNDINRTSFGYDLCVGPYFRTIKAQLREKLSVKPVRGGVKLSRR